jgi:predicted nuclease with TOPRIM domain
LDDYRRAFEEAAQNFKIHMEEYNARVARWNEGTERPDAEFSALQSRKKELEGEQEAVEKKRIDLNSRGEELNNLGDALNELARKHNLEVEKFNGTYISSRDFEKGLFDGKAINIYEFEKEGDLKVALIHEFGHAIGLGHLDNPNAIMSRKLAQQDFNNIRLSEDDVKLLKSKVN